MISDALQALIDRTLEVGRPAGATCAQLAASGGVDGVHCAAIAP
jgi:hypothetical protein